VNRQKKYWFF